MWREGSLGAEGGGSEGEGRVCVKRAPLVKLAFFQLNVRVLSRGLAMGFAVEKGPEKGFEKGFLEGGFQKVNRTPPRRAQPLTRLRLRRAP